jgi:hypothetical protein
MEWTVRVNKFTSALIFFLVLLFIMSGCVNRFDSDLNAYLEFKKEHNLDGRYFQTLSSGEKTAIFFGSQKMHPPSHDIAELVSNEPIQFIFALRAEISVRKDSWAVDELVDVVYIMKKKNTISLEQIQSLDIDGLCKTTSPDFAPCIDNKNELLSADIQKQ